MGLNCRGNCNLSIRMILIAAAVVVVVVVVVVIIMFAKKDSALEQVPWFLNVLISHLLSSL